jgi:hypothetical protein
VEVDWFPGFLVRSRSAAVDPMAVELALPDKCGARSVVHALDAELVSPKQWRLERRELVIDLGSIVFALRCVGLAGVIEGIINAWSRDTRFRRCSPSTPFWSARTATVRIELRIAKTKVPTTHRIGLVVVLDVLQALIGRRSASTCLGTCRADVDPARTI